MRELYRDGYDYLLARPDVTAALLLGGLILGPLALLAARLFGWAKIASVLAGVSLALALSVTLVRPQLRLAPWAASSARSMSSAVDRAISVNGWPVTGEMFSKKSPLAGGTNSPPM